MFHFIIRYIKTNGLLALFKMLFGRIFGGLRIYRFFLYMFQYPDCRIDADSILGDVICGKGVSIWGTRIGNSTIGDYTYIGGLGGSMANVDIGKYCSINAGVKVTPKGLTDHMSLPSTYSFYNVGLSPFFDPHWLKDEKMVRTTIGNDVFIGTNAIILGGVTIGNGAVIGAGTVVTKDVPAYAICVGNPGKIVRYRFNSETIAYLEDVQWWNKNEAEIRELLPYLSQPLRSETSCH